MFHVITQYKATGKRGGYTLQWRGLNKPSWCVGPNNTCTWFKFKVDAVFHCEEMNK